MGVMGICTALISNMISKVQSTGKSQIVYASSAQLGIMFIEIALGFHVFAVFHFVSNALFRT